MRVEDRTPPAVVGERPGTVNPIGRWPAQLYVAIERVAVGGPRWDDGLHEWAGDTPPVIIGAGLEAAVMADSPALYLPLQEDGDDVSGHTRHATLVGSPIFTVDLDCPGGSCLMLNGSSMFGYTPDSTPLWLEVTADMTYECWANRTTGTGQYTAISHADTGVSTSFTFDTAGVSLDDKWRGLMTDYAGVTFRGAVDTATIVNGTWNHLAAVYTGGTLTIYRNGAVVASASSGATGSRATGFKSLWVGRFNSDYSRYWPGRIAHVAAYNTALTPTRILAHYTAGIT